MPAARARSSSLARWAADPVAREDRPGKGARPSHAYADDHPAGQTDPRVRGALRENRRDERIPNDVLDHGSGVPGGHDDVQPADRLPAAPEVTGDVRLADGGMSPDVGEQALRRGRRLVQVKLVFPMRQALNGLEDAPLGLRSESLHGPYAPGGTRRLEVGQAPDAQSVVEQDHAWQADDLSQLHRPRRQLRP